VSAESFGGNEQDAPEWRYANCIQVGHNVFEFMLDFGQVPEAGEAKYSVRIVGNPQFAKALWRTLGEAIHEYERAFGMIRDTED